MCPNLAFSLRPPGRKSPPPSGYLFVSLQVPPCQPQKVSADRSVPCFSCPEKCLPLPSPGSECASVGVFLPCPYKRLPLPFPDSECASAGLFAFCALTGASLCCPQDVSARLFVGFFPCPDKCLPLPSPGSEYALVGRIFAMS